MLLYRQTYPTPGLVLAGDRYTLSFARPASSSSSSKASSSSPQIELSFVPIASFDVHGCTYLGTVSGSLGLIQLANEIFLAVISNAQPIESKYWPDEVVSRIGNVDFFSVSSAAWDEHAQHGDGTNTPNGSGAASSSLGGSGTDANGSQLFEHPAAAMRKILSNGQFYFSSQKYDISTRLEERLRKKEAEDETPYDPRFVWNGFLMDSLLGYRANLDPTEQRLFDESGFVVPVIQGFVGISDFTLSGNPVTLSITSRLGFARAGTRFNTRGIDDDGNVANFVETETVFRTKDSAFSFVQVRGSVPLFWEQQGTTPFGGQRLQVTRPPVASQPAFNKHFASLLNAYPHIEVVNLLSTKDHEALLSNAYREHIMSLNAQLGEQEGLTASGSKQDQVDYVEFDFHKEARIAGGIESVCDLIRRDPQLGGTLAKSGFCLVALDEKSGSTLLHKQEGVYRTNCLDTLDRTNVVQDILSRLALENYLRNLVSMWSSSDILLGAHRTLWAENGDALSRIYAGTGALNTSFTRSGKRTFAGALSDATKSVSRMYISNFMDKGKQLAIDALLGNLANQQKVVVVDPVRDSVESALKQQLSEYSSQNQYLLFAGTFNVNGKVPGNESLLPWLFPDAGVEPDIIALGFQELVELSPQQIMATDPAKLRQWQGYIEQAIKQRSNGKADYVLLRSEQLVGTCLIIFTKTTIAKHVRNVEATTKKTGLKGMAGNKGAVAVRLELDDSTFCFVTAHFAAGHSNYEQRNLDYATIATGLQFRRGQRIVAHENIVYFGDLNYRVSMPNDEVRELTSHKDYVALVENDQLTSCMRDQSVFAGYSEGPLVFAPTYKYDNGTDRYDTSEKQRIPAWTDRILYRGHGLELVKYDRAEILLSDHRPVYGLFKVGVQAIDHGKKDRIERELLQKLAPTKVKPTVSLIEIDDGAESADPSTEQQSWWQDVDFAVLSQLRVPNDGAMTNPFEDRASSGAASADTAGTLKPSHSIKRKPPPPMPESKPAHLTSKVNGSAAGAAYPPSQALIKPAIPRKVSSSSSLLDEDNDEYGRFGSRPRNNREATTEWQVISPSGTL